jgi:hypothetical protein
MDKKICVKFTGGREGMLVKFVAIRAVISVSQFDFHMLRTTPNVDWDEYVGYS